MTNVRVDRRSGKVIGFRIKGHAGAHGEGEYDMVCAAISGITFTALGALEAMCGIDTHTEKGDCIDMKLPAVLEEAVRYKAEIILEAMEIGLKQIEAQYPRYIRTVCKEV